MNANANLIASLIKRVEVQLPLNNAGKSIESLESDVLMQKTVSTIVEISVHKLPIVINYIALLLDSVSKSIQPSYQSNADIYIPFDVLQSQVYVIRLFSACLKNHWKTFKNQKLNSPQDPNVAKTQTSETENSSDPSNTQTKPFVHIDPPQLNEELVGYLLPLMSRLLNQIHTIEERNSQFAIMSSDHVNDASKFDPQTLEYIREVHATSGKILYYISASNWRSYYMKIKEAIATLAAASDKTDVSFSEIKILAFACLDIPKLQTILSELNPYFLKMRDQSRQLFARTMRMAILKWMEAKPTQFAEICANNGQESLMNTGTLFDICNAADTDQKKMAMWPLLTLLLAFSQSQMVQAFLGDPTSQNKKSNFLRQLKKAFQSSKSQRIAIVCYVDLYKAATFIPPKDDTILRHIAEEIEIDLRPKIWNFAEALAVDYLPTKADSNSHQALYTDYFLARLRLKPMETLDALLPPLFEENAPVILRQAFVESCLAVAGEENPLPWNPSLSSIRKSICGPLRRMFLQVVKQELSTAQSLSDVSNTTSGSKKQNNGGEKRLQNVTNLLQSILKLFKLDPLCALGGEDTKIKVDENANIMSAMVSLMKHNDRRVRHCVADCLIQFHDTNVVDHWGPSISLLRNFWRISSHVVLTLSRQIIDYRQNEELSKGFLKLLSDILSARNQFLNEVSESAHENSFGLERIQSNVTLEIALLVCLCSPISEISLVATKCLGHMCTEAKMVNDDNLMDTASRTSQHMATFSYNLEIYDALSHEKPVTQGNHKQAFGKKAQQKQIRRYLRLMNAPTPGVLAAWEEVWKRWKILTQTVSRFGMESLKDSTDAVSLVTTSTSSVKKIGGLVRQDKVRTSTIRTNTPTVHMGRIETDDEKQTEWQNYTGFLAALGGSRFAADKSDDDYNEDKRSKFSDSGISSPSRQASMIEKFMADMVNLLASDNLMVRESVKQTLGEELSASLYPILFRHLESALSNCFDINGDAVCIDPNTFFVEQAVFILKMILDRIADPSDYLLSVDFSALINQLALYINKLPRNNYTTMRVMIMMCHLTEVLMMRKGQVIIKDEVRTRNKLLEVIVEWTSYFTTSSTSSAVNSQNKEVQQDLDQVCMKAVVAILDKLPLQSTDHRETDKSVTKNRLFQKYMTLFVQLLDRCHRHEAEAKKAVIASGAGSALRNNRELHYMASKPADTYQYWTPFRNSAVNAISNLLSANVDAGLKYTLAMGYHEDTRTRTAFIQVLSNILTQGAQFDTLAESVMFDRYQKLVEILVEADIEVSLSLCEVCNSSDAVGIAEALLNSFKFRKKAFVLLKALVEREVYATEQEATLFRGTNMATRILSSFARDACLEYIQITLQPAMEAVNALPEDEITSEMDPQVCKPDESTQKNKQNVCRATELFLDVICNSTSNAPKEFRQELALIVSVVNKRFPDASKTAIGGFVFLRLFNPAILTPENSGFPKKALPKSKAVRKLLLQVTRMMQNLANNVMFGAKEPHLISLNDFITGNLYRVASFLREISTASVTEGEVRDVRVDGTSFLNLHRYLSDNFDKLSRDLTIHRVKDGIDTQKILSWKRTMDEFSTLLAQLGSPPEIAQVDLTTARSYAYNKNNNEFQEFMRRNKHRDTSFLVAKEVFYKDGVNRLGHPVFYAVIRNLWNRDGRDNELLIYHMLKVIEPYINRPFVLVFDLTRLSEDCEIPAQFLSQFFQLIFCEVCDNMSELHMFNSNFYTQRYVRKLPRILLSKVLKRTHFAITIAELEHYIARHEIRLPKDNYEMEKEMNPFVTEGFLTTHLQPMIPVTIRISTNYLQVITKHEHEVLLSLTTTFNDAYSMTEVSGFSLPPINANQKDSGLGEVYVTHGNNKLTMVLVVPHREEVYKALVDRKRNHDANITEVNHGIRPADVPGRILNIALLNMASEDPGLRLSAYRLLYSLCAAFRFENSNQLMDAKDLCIPFNTKQFVINSSATLAKNKTNITLEFLNECILGFKSSANDTARQIVALEYMAPWIKNLVLFIHVPQGKDPEKVKDVLRAFIDITVDRPKTYQHIQKYVWGTIRDTEEMHSIVVDTLVQYSVERGIGSLEAETITDTIVTMNSNAICGKIINKARRVLHSTTINCRQSLTKHQSWNEMTCLIRLLLNMSFDAGTSQEAYIAELFHIVALVAATGPTFIRSSVHGLVVNTIHNLITNTKTNPHNMKKLKYLLDEVSDGKYRVHYKLSLAYANTFTITKDTLTDDSDTIDQNSLEMIVKLMLDVMSAAAPTIDIYNAWQARWMSLVTSMTFQFNPALQPRSFVILGCLAQDEIDDDLLFQILVVLRNELHRYEEGKSVLVVSILICLTNIVKNLSANSRYLKSMFWLAISIIQMSGKESFSYATKLLHAVLRTLDAHKCFDGRSIEEVLMEFRLPFASIFEKSDSFAAVNFEDHFSFALTVVLLQGFRYTDAKDIIFMCLTTLLEIEPKTYKNPEKVNSKSLGYFCGLLPFTVTNDTARELLYIAGVDASEEADMSPSLQVCELIWNSLDIPDNETGVVFLSLLAGMLSLVDNEAERLFLYNFLSTSAICSPEIFYVVYDSLTRDLNSITLSSENIALNEAAKNILLVACSEPIFNVTNRNESHSIFLQKIKFTSLGQAKFNPSVAVSNANKAKITSELLRIICD